VRRLAVEMLSDARDPRARDVIVDALVDPDPMVRANALHGLEELGSDDLPALERALEDHDAGVRLAGVTALHATGDEGTTSRMLLPAIGDVDAAVSAAASVALLPGAARSAATTRLRSMLSDDDPEVRLIALDRLRLAPPEDVGSLAAPLVADASLAVRALALGTLAAAGLQVAFAPALECLGAEEPLVRAAAIEALASLDVGAHRGRLETLAQAQSSLAVEDHALATAIPPVGEASRLLRDAVLDRGRRQALVALWRSA
jgi:HEAT repeat protein